MTNTKLLPLFSKDQKMVDENMGNSIKKLEFPLVKMLIIITSNPDFYIDCNIYAINCLLTQTT
jgi:hypothetical protein